MDFNNIFNRVRKIKTNHNTTTAPMAIDHNNNSSKSGLKKIATSRKIIPTSANANPTKRAVCQVHSTDSTNSTGSSVCNTSCASNEAVVPSAIGPESMTDRNTKLNNNTKQPVTLQYSAADSGIESSKCTKHPVTQQDSNGSVLSGHINMASELERRCQAAAKLAFKEENKEYKEQKKEKAREAKGQIERPVGIESSGPRRAAIDLDSLAKKQQTDAYGNTKKKKKKKHRLKSDQSHARITVDKIMKRTSSSSDVRKSDRDDDGGGGGDGEYNAFDETKHSSECDTSEYTDDAFADDETDRSSSSDGHQTGSSEFDSGNAATNSSEHSDKEERSSSGGGGEQQNAGKVEQQGGKRTIVEVKAPQLIDKGKLGKKKEPPPNKNPTVDSIHNINKKYQHTELPSATFPSPATNNKVQPTSRRVNGVTLRDLYSLRAVLSDSDNGTVFSGRRRIDNAAVAIKRIMKCKVKRWHMIKDKSVPMEIALLRKVNEQRHPGVVTLLEWFECSDCFLLVMARPTPVLDLFDFVSEKKRLDEVTARIILVQVLQAMVHCHAKLVLHRDIKLENVLVKTDTLTVTIIDFGCGTAFDENLYKDFAGTPQYYPPEYYICKQYHGLPAAVWSVGVMLYAMLCGRLPFASAHEIVHLEPSWHGSFCRKISPAAKDLVEGMLKKQPRRRTHMNDILKHRWLKGIKYNHLTGDVTIITDDQLLEKSMVNSSSNVCVQISQQQQQQQQQQQPTSASSDKRSSNV